LWSLIVGLFAWIFSISFLEFLYVLGTLIIIAMITVILYALVRLNEIRQEDKRKKKPTVTASAMPTGMPVVVGTEPTKAANNDTWKHIREELLSSNDSDWKLAIIEADIYMDRVLDDMGFHGDTTSDKLKQVTPDRLPSVQIAWEVHKIRNRIAHEGAAFVLTMPEARRILSYYEIIFTDLGVI
jgi:hypothetical protein